MARFPYLSEIAIEHETLDVLRGFEKKYGEVNTPAIPIDAIVENYLGFTLEFNDELGDDVMGCIDCKNDIIVINTSLDTTENPRMEGRYHYTVAHEGGHGVLHKPIIMLENSTPSFLSEDTQASTILCRKNNENDSVEWQANFFASCILMPKRKVLEQWKAIFGNTPHIMVPSLAHNIRRNSSGKGSNFPRSLNEILPNVIGSIGNARAIDQGLVENHLKPLARAFHVSPKALYIRLKHLGLLREENSEAALVV